MLKQGLIDQSESEIEYDRTHKDVSVEKRISGVDESLNVSAHQQSILDGVSNTSSVRNLANDYVTGLVAGLKQ